MVKRSPSERMLQAIRIAEMHRNLEYAKLQDKAKAALEVLRMVENSFIENGMGEDYNTKHYIHDSVLNLGMVVENLRKLQL